MKEVKITLLTKDFREGDVDFIDYILSVVFKTKDIIITVSEIKEIEND